MLFKLYKIVPITLIVVLSIGIISNILSPFTFMMSGLLSICAILIWRNWRKMKHAADKLSSKQMNLIISISFLAIFIIQLAFLKYLPSTIYHDPFRVLHQAEMLNTPHHYWGETSYFWRYPNNVPIAYFLSLWFKFTDIFHLSHNLAIHSLSIIFLDSFIVLAVYTVKKIYKRNIGILAGLVFLVFGPFAYTYYLQVFYTDLPNMLFVLIVFNLINNWSNMKLTKKILSGILIICLMTIGQMVKPNLIILAVAIAIIMIGFFVINRKELKKIIVPLLLIVVGLMLASPAKSFVNKSTDFVPNTKYQLPTTHWIWMSYNPKSSGAYVGSDVQEMLSYPTEKQRSKEINKALPKRFEELGPLGLIQKWVTKIGLLLNVNSLPDAYTGGVIEAPTTYAKVQYLMGIVSQFVMRLGFILFYAISLLRAIKMLLAKKEEVNIIAALAAVTAVGFMLFHVFIWEAGTRYGQVMIPLLLMINSGSSYDIRKQVQLGSFRIFGPLAILGGIIAAVIIPQPIMPHAPIFVSAQRSQLSRQYNYHATEVSSKYEVSQKVRINHGVTEIAVSAPNNKNINAILIDTKTEQSRNMSRDKTIFYVDDYLKPGTYKMVLKAKDKNKPFKVMMTKMKNYKLTNYPLSMNGKSYEYRSLIYQASYFK